MTLPALDEHAEHTEHQLEEKLTGFLNRWATNYLMPQIAKQWTACMEDFLIELKQKLQAMRDTVRANPTPMKKEDAPRGKRSSIGTVVDLRLTQWDDSKLLLIETEDLAATAFDCSDVLQKEFRAKGIFLSYWRELRAGTLRHRRKENAC